MVNNQSGALTLDFIFAFVLVLSMTLLLGVFSFTLSIVESVQYLTYSSSRAYFAGHLSEADQRQSAENKFNQLSETGSYKKLLKKDWFDVSLASVGDASNIYEASNALDIFQGVRTKIVVGLLDLQIPLFGATTPDTPFTAYMTSFLGREPTTEECLAVVRQRYEGILKLGEYSGPGGQGQYVAYDDNGC